MQTLRVAPVSVRIVIACLIFSSVDLLIRGIGAVVANLAASVSTNGIIALITLCAVMVSIPLGAAACVLVGARIAPILVTLVSLWGLAQVMFFEDLLDVVIIIASGLMGVAVWLPASLAFGRQLRTQRRVARAANFKQTRPPFV